MMVARLAVLHWVVRLVRREWRQHALVIALLAFGVASSVVAVSTLVRLNTPTAREIGGAETVMTLQVTDEAGVEATSLSAALSKITAAYPELEVVARSIEGPDGIRLVGQDPVRPLGQAWLHLIEGRWPNPGEIALTTRATERLSAGGTIVTIGAEAIVAGKARTVVGYYENPTNLDDTSGIVSVAETGPWSEVSVLFPGNTDAAVAAMDELVRTANRNGIRPALDLYQQERDTVADGTGAAILGYGIGTVLCLQIAVLASAGFTVLANRRRRQLGLLAALGAQPGAIGSVMTTTGLVVGVIGGIVGLALGVAIAVATTPLLQRVVDFRLSSTALGWFYLIPMLPLAVAVAVAAAWWPARRVRQISAIDAITDRTDRKAGIAQSLCIGIALLTAGAVTMTIGAPKNDAILVVGSIVAIMVGALLLAPSAAILLGRLALIAPLPVRIAWRDIARNRSRSGAAIAAAAIAIALPFGVATFAKSSATTWQPDVPTNVAMVISSERPVGAMALTTTAPDDVRAIASTVPDARLVPLVGFTDETITDYSIHTTRSNGETIPLRTALATTEMLQLMNLEPPSPKVDVIVWASGQIQAEPDLVVQQRTAPKPNGFPEALLFTIPEGVSLDQTSVNTWFMVADQPFNQLERDRLERATTKYQGAFVNLSDRPPPFVALRTVAVTLGGLFGLAAVAVAAALIRTENTDDARLLVSVGARPRTTRSIAAATVAGLTFAASVIAVVASFAILSGVYLNPDENFDFIMPWVELAAVLVAMPLVGAAIAWLVTSTRHDRLALRNT